MESPWKGRVAFSRPLPSSRKRWKRNNNIGGYVADKKRKMVDNAEEEKRKCTKEGGGGVFSSSFWNWTVSTGRVGEKEGSSPTGGVCNCQKGNS
jgi:hypothetical protein